MPTHHVSKTPSYDFLNNAVKNEPIWPIFGAKKSWIYFTPVKCSHCTLKTQKVIFSNDLSSVFLAATEQVLMAKNCIYFFADEFFLLWFSYEFKK